MCPPFCFKTRSRRRRHSLMPNAYGTSPRLACIKSPTSTKLAAVQADRGQPISSRLYRYTASVDFIQQRRCTRVLLNIGMLKCPQRSSKAKLKLLTRHVAPFCFMKLTEYRFNRRVDVWRVPKSCKSIQAFCGQTYSGSVTSSVF